MKHNKKIRQTNQIFMFLFVVVGVYCMFLAKTALVYVEGLTCGAFIYDISYVY